MSKNLKPPVPAIDARTLLAGLFKLGLMVRTDVDLSTQQINAIAVLLADDLLAELAKETSK